MTRLYASVSKDFNPASFGGLMVAAEDPRDASGFTEKGWDSVDSEDPAWFAVEPAEGVRFASEEDVIAAARKAGYEVFETHDAFERAHPGSSWATHGSAYVLEEAGINEILANPKVTAELERSGFAAARELVVVENTQPELYMFWNPSSFTAEGPLPLETRDPADPYARVLPETAQARPAP